MVATATGLSAALGDIWKVKRKRTERACGPDPTQFHLGNGEITNGDKEIKGIVFILSL